MWFFVKTSRSFGGPFSDRGHHKYHLGNGEVVGIVNLILLGSLRIIGPSKLASFWGPYPFYTGSGPLPLEGPRILRVGCFFFYNSPRAKCFFLVKVDLFHNSLIVKYLLLFFSRTSFSLKHCKKKTNPNLLYLFALRFFSEIPGWPMGALWRWRREFCELERYDRRDRRHDFQEIMG